jgi:hypothetical protein
MHGRTAIPSRVTNKASKVEPGWKPLLVDRYEFCHTVQLDRHFGETICHVVLFDVNNLNKTSANELVSPIEQWAHVFQDSKYIRWLMIYINGPIFH